MFMATEQTELDAQTMPVFLKNGLNGRQTSIEVPLDATIGVIKQHIFRTEDWSPVHIQLSHGGNDWTQLDDDTALSDSDCGFSLGKDADDAEIVYELRTVLRSYEIKVLFKFWVHKNDLQDRPTIARVVCMRAASIVDSDVKSAMDILYRDGERKFRWKYPPRSDDSLRVIAMREYLLRLGEELKSSGKCVHFELKGLEPENRRTKALDTCDVLTMTLSLIFDIFVPETPLRRDEDPGPW